MKTKPAPLSHEAIAARAYQLWEEAGRPEGRAEEFWRQAETQLQPAPPVTPATAAKVVASETPAHVVPPTLRPAVQPVALPAAPTPPRKRRAR